jgi:hypothetical protein
VAAVAVVAVLLVVLLLLSKDRDLPGQEVCCSPTVKNIWPAAYSPWLLCRQVSGTFALQPQLDGPISGGYNKLYIFWLSVDPFESVVAVPHRYVTGRRTRASKEDIVRFLATFDVYRDGITHQDFFGRVYCHRNSGIPSQWKARSGVARIDGQQ